MSLSDHNLVITTFITHRIVIGLVMLLLGDPRGNDKLEYLAEYFFWKWRKGFDEAAN